MCSSNWETHIPSDRCSSSWETHIPSDMCSLTSETHIPSDMCSPTWETHIPSDMFSPTWETHIPSDPTCIPKGLTHGVCPKMAIFFLGNINQENVFYNTQKLKTSFYAIKTTSSNSRKIHIFPKGLTHGLGPKMAIFPTFFFYTI